MKTLLIGLTGGIGSGKTTALREFARLGARTLDLDQISRDLSRPGRPGCRRILKAFGPSVSASAGGVDRKKLAGLVFSSPPLLRRLERLTHPLILSAMRRWAARPSVRASVVDVPLLFEKRLGGEFDATLLVTASRSSRLARVSRRDRVPEKAVSRRMNAQMPERDKKRLADVTVSNEGSANDLRRKIREYYKAFELIHGRT